MKGQKLHHCQQCENTDLNQILNQNMINKRADETALKKLENTAPKGVPHCCNPK